MNEFDYLNQLKEPFFIFPSPAQDITTRKILVILTNIDKMTTSGRSTGWYLPELAHPYKLLVDAGFELESISPKGGQAPVVSKDQDMTEVERKRLFSGALLVGFLTSSSTTRLYRERVPRLTSDSFTCCHTRHRAGRP